jgi:hypothetical protein
MVITPNVSLETAGSGAQNSLAARADLQARRNSATGISDILPEIAGEGGTQASNPEAALLHNAETGSTNSPDDILDAPAADSIMQSLRSAMLGQSGAAMAGQGNLSSQSVLDLLQ